MEAEEAEVAVEWQPLHQMLGLQDLLLHLLLLLLAPKVVQELIQLAEPSFKGKVHHRLLDGVDAHPCRTSIVLRVVVDVDAAVDSEVAGPRLVLVNMAARSMLLLLRFRSTQRSSCEKCLALVLRSMTVLRMWK